MTGAVIDDAVSNLNTTKHAKVAKLGRWYFENFYFVLFVTFVVNSVSTLVAFASLGLLI